MTLPRPVRLVVLSLHLCLNGSWLGGVLTMALLVSLARPGLDVAAFVINDVVVWSSLAVLATSLLFSLFTSWGFVRFWWVATKWVALVALAVLGVLMRTPAVNALAAHADLTGTPGPRDSLLWLLGKESALLIGVFLLSALKPWGRLVPGEGRPPKWLAPAVSVGFLLAAGFAVAQSLWLAELRRTPIKSIEVARLPDDEWEGTARVGVTARVRATTRGGRLTAVQVLELPGGFYPDLARGITKRMVAQQRIDVDAVTGATTTSRAIQRATQAALEPTEH